MTTPSRLPFSLIPAALTFDSLLGWPETVAVVAKVRDSFDLHPRREMRFRHDGFMEQTPALHCPVMAHTEQADTRTRTRTTHRCPGYPQISCKAGSMSQRLQ
ncbi:hypothetical protein BDW68DRAFT_153334 [Aspergillus falconensis]